jgi:ribosomal protein S18 acetylase RimI-like enzyme
MTPEITGEDPFFFESLSVNKKIDLPLQQMVAIYVEAFSSEPWFEKWQDEAALEVLLAYADKAANFAANMGPDGSLQGFGIGLGIEKCSIANELAEMGFLEPAKFPGVYYVAELCTKATARGQGVCTKVLAGLIESARQQGYQEIITRTRVDNDKMLRIFKKLGFVALSSYFTETGGVASERIILGLRLCNNA